MDMDLGQFPILSSLLKKTGVKPPRPQTRVERNYVKLFEQRLGIIGTFDDESEMRGLEGWFRDKSGMSKVRSALAELECAIKFARGGWCVDLLSSVGSAPDLRVVKDGTHMFVEVTRITQENIPVVEALYSESGPPYDFSACLGPDITWPNHVGARVIDGESVVWNRTKIERVFVPSATKEIRSYLSRRVELDLREFRLDIYADSDWKAFVREVEVDEDYFPGSKKRLGSSERLMLRLDFRQDSTRDSGLYYSHGVTGIFRDTYEGIEAISKRLREKVEQKAKSSGLVQNSPYCVAIWNEDIRLDEPYFTCAVEGLESEEVLRERRESVSDFAGSGRLLHFSHGELDAVLVNHRVPNRRDQWFVNQESHVSRSLSAIARSLVSRWND